MNPHIVDLLCRLEQARTDEARAFVMVTIDEDTGTVVHATGPFSQAELALVQAGRDQADWREHAGPGEGDLDYVVVPLWEPTP